MVTRLLALRFTPEELRALDALGRNFGAANRAEIIRYALRALRHPSKVNPFASALVKAVQAERRKYRRKRERKALAK